MRKVLPWLIFGIAVVWFIIETIFSYPYVVQGETSAELVLSKMLSEGKGFIISPDWYYSTEIRFLNIQLVFAPLFWIFSNWRVIYTVGMLILNAILLLTMLFFLKAINQQKLFPWVGTVLICPFSQEFFYYINFACGYYIPHVVLAMFIIGFSFYFMRTVGAKKWWWLIGGTILAWAGGMEGYRMIITLTLPLLLTALLYWLLNLKTVHRDQGQKLFIYTVICLVTSLVGLMCNVFWLSSEITIHKSSKFTDFSSEGLHATFQGLLDLFGYLNNNQVLSFVSFLNIFAIILFVWFIVICIKIVRHAANYGQPCLLLVYFVGFGMLLMGVIYCFTFTIEFYAARYFMLQVFFGIPIFAIYLSKLKLPQINFYQLKLNLTKIVYGLLCCCLLGAMVIMRINLYQQPDDYSFPTGYLQYNSVKKISELLLANECYNGYSPTWSGKLFTKLTNGKIEVWSNISFFPTYVENWTSLAITTSFLQEKAHKAQKPTGKVFVCVNTYLETEQVPKLLAANAADKKIYEDKCFIVYLFDDVEAAFAATSA